MSIFEDIELTWEGVPYRISGDDSIMRLLAAIEDHLTFIELQGARSQGKMPLAKLAAAYSAALRFGGCRVSAAEVYNGMFAQSKAVSMITEAVTGLLQMMMPASVHEQAAAEAGKAEDKPTAKKQTGAKS